MAGYLVISLDFELLWGVFENRTRESYGENILTARKAIPVILNLFKDYNIHATWAIVGFLFNKDKEALYKNMPGVIPSYNDPNISSYDYIKRAKNLGSNEDEDPYHFAPSLIKLIRDFPNQEIGSHTYSHYYCVEEGQNEKSFAADIEKAIEVAKAEGIKIESIIFPRNQVNEEYLKICAANNILYYRGNENAKLHSTKKREDWNRHLRLLRILDSYINISGLNIYPIAAVKSLPINIAASAFFRPYYNSLSFLEGAKLSRIKKAMTQAAKQDKVFHLWWHPHNFGKNLNENINSLKAILNHYKRLQENYQMQSLNMAELGLLIYERKNSIVSTVK